MSGDEQKISKQTVFKDESEEEKSQIDSEVKTSSGIEQNVAGLLCYLLWVVTGIVLLLIEKENRFVRFHAMQSILISIVLFIISFILALIPFIGWILGLLLAPITFILWIFMMYKAYKGEWIKLPIIGDIAKEQVDKMAQ